MLLNSYSQIKSIMKEYNIAPNKSFGQNFLLDENILEKISGHASENVLEIGPGMGALTHFLCENSKKVVAVEIDSGMVNVLKFTQKDHDNLTVIHGDILDKNIQNQAEEILGEKYNVIANLPYYITTPIIMALLERNVNEMILMMQKEVADRIVAKPGTKAYGSLSVAVQFFADVEKLFIVKPGSFYPRPNVDSCVLKIKRKQTPAVEVINEKLFFRVVKASFSMRRKTLLNNLTSNFDFDRQMAANILDQAGIDQKRRGETLNMQEFANLTEIINKNHH